MSDPLLFTVTGETAAPAQPLTLAEAGLTERAHLQEWVLANPEILGTDVKVLTFEFDWWAGGNGARERERLDVLGIDTAGRLVVAELKRDRAPATTDTQAIRYAALASRLVDAGGLEDGAQVTLSPTTEVDGEARDQITAWIDADPTRGTARWRNDPNAPLAWAVDGQRYTPTSLARRIIAEATDDDRSPRGTRWWRTEEGDDLASLADAVAPADHAAASGTEPRD